MKRRVYLCIFHFLRVCTLYLVLYIHRVQLQLQ